MQLIHDIRHEMLERGSKLMQLPPYSESSQEENANPPPGFSFRHKQIRKELEEMPSMVGGRIKDETLWSCVSCGACEAVCPVFIEHPLKILQMRSHLVLAESRMPSELARMFRGIENNFNPWGIGSDQRMDWAKDLDVPIMEEKGSAEYLVWIGCVGSFDDRAKKISRTWIQLLQKAGVDFAVLGLEEGCTGDPARRAGNEFLFQMMVENNLEIFKKYQVQKILVTCPHCYHSFKNEYPQFGGKFEVWHHSQFLRRLIEEGRLKPNKVIDTVMTYHDSCYLGRWNNIYDPPRQVLAACATAQNNLIEMPHRDYKSFCCGAGGARLWMEEPSPRINEKRTAEALDTGAKVIATACPYCMVMLSDGIKGANREDDVRVLDIVEVMNEAL
jgi:Fe-S oxidoreductase